MRKINIPIKDQAYNVYIKRNILKDIASYLDVNREIVIITDDFIPKTYLNTISEKMSNSQIFKVPQGETSKSMEIAYSIMDEMVDSKVTRNCLVIALGGGVVGDLAGFIASIYMRGVEFIQIPTTLLSQIDSSVGGKVGINASNMKNAIGAFHQPSLVLVDPETLKTLAPKEFNNGVAEMIKYGMIADETLFNDLLTKDITLNIEDYLEKSINIKKRFVIDDVYDQGNRQILNFGHTIGHAIEKHSNYAILHGEAIAIGMALIAKKYEYYSNLITLLQKYNLPTSYHANNELYNYIKTDKKATNDTINLILVPKIGTSIIKNIKITEIKNYL